MCLIFLALKNHSKYKLVLAANRDEFYDRKTAPASFWDDHPQILGGRDVEAMGTWLGVTTNGRICMVTNFRDLRNIKTNAPSRGKLVTDFLLGKSSGEEYLKKVEPRAAQYNGFSLIAGTFDSLYYFSNYRDGVILLNSGLFGLSNHLLETPWPKVEKGKMEIQGLLKKPDLRTEDFFPVLSDETIHGDEYLPDTGVGLDRERALSAAFIKSPGYGTRSSTVIMIDYNNHVSFHERVFDPASSSFSHYTFQYPSSEAESLDKK
jgi:uncharacterized protein with NRDE domain